MDTKRLVTGTVVGAIVMTVLGFLCYEVVFAGFFEGQMLVTARETPIVWAAVVSSLAHALLLTLVIEWTGATSVAGGLKIGALVGLLVWFGADMILYGAFEFTMLTGALADSAISVVLYGIAGAAIGAVNGRGAEQTAAPTPA